MALDVIKEVGPGSHFLRQKHTRKHIRDFPLSPIKDEMYINEQPRSAQEVALEEFNSIYENHHPEPLPKEKLTELDRILAAADKTAEYMNS
jgi:trimethylamine:corrinoid methyltransferase-like protein